MRNKPRCYYNLPGRNLVLWCDSVECLKRCDEYDKIKLNKTIVNKALVLLVLVVLSCSKPQDTAPTPPTTGGTDPEMPMSLAGRPGVLQGAYGLEGTFTADTQGIYINDDYLGNTAPGPVWFLSNTTGSIVGGVRLAEAVGSGATTLPTTMALDYNYLVLWCEPFSVPIGFGQIPK